MTIIPETLMTLRKSKGLSQERLAEAAKIAKRTIARLEKGETPHEKVRARTVTRLEKALGVEPETLSRSVSDDEQRKAEEARDGQRRVPVLFDWQMRQNYSFTMRHYGVSVDDLIAAAPWMFTLLAEMSLKDRRQKLDAANEAFKAAMDRVPNHLKHARIASSYFDDAYHDEHCSIIARDLFGKKLLETAQNDPFDPDFTNPFVEFVRRLAEETSSDALLPEQLELRSNGMPDWPPFYEWFQQLTGGDWWAQHALEHGFATIEDIPDELMGDEKTAERIAFLTDRIPEEERARIEEKRSRPLEEILKEIL